MGYVAGNGSYPSPAIRRFTGAFEGDRLHGSLQIIGKLKDTLMGRAIEGAVIRIKKVAPDAGIDAMLLLPLSSRIGQSIDVLISFSPRTSPAIATKSFYSHIIPPAIPDQTQP
jgi:hypothetical protein